MSITSTLTTIGAAGAGGGVSYWANEIAFSGNTVFYQSKLDYSPDLIALTVSTTTSGGGSLNTGTVITLDQKGIVQNQQRFSSNQNNYAGGFYPLDFLYDEDTSAWYSSWYISGYNFIGRHSSSPTGGFSWLKSLGHTGASTEHSNLYSLDSSNIVGRFTNSSGATRIKIAKSDGSQQVYKAYANTVNSTRMSAPNLSESKAFYVSYKNWSGIQAAKIIPVALDPSNDSSGSNLNGAFIYAQDTWEGTLFSTQTYASGVDGSGNFWGVTGNTLYSLNSTATTLRYALSATSIVCFCHAPVSDVLWALDDEGRIFKINTSGQPINGTAYRVTFPSQAQTPNWQASELKIDEENNVAYIVTIGTQTKNRIIIKRPLDSSLDGTYGNYTLSTETGLSFPNRYTPPFGTEFRRASDSSLCSTLSDTLENKLSATTYDSRFSNTKTDIG